MVDVVTNSAQTTPTRYALKELCHHISIFLVTEAGWGSPLSNQVRGRCGFVTS